MKYYAYYRVSTKTQAEANSTEMQIDVVGKYCESNHIEICGTFSDEGISGTKEEREGLYDLLGTMQNGDRVVVQNTSRLWRNDFVKVFIKKELMKLDADIISVEQPTYTIYEKDPNEFFLNYIMEGVDQYNRMEISMKLAKGRKTKAANGGKSCGNTPCGYKWNGREVVVDKENCQFIRDMFEKCIEYKGNMSAIKRWTISNGFRTVRGNEYSVATIKKMLCNDFYIGVITYAGKKRDGRHEAIIDREVFEAVQKLVA